VYWGQQTGAIEDKLAVKIQSASAAPGIATAPRSVLQVPMAGNVPREELTGSGGVCASVSMVSAGSHVERAEEDNEEDEESGHADTYVCAHGGVEALDDDENDE